MPGENTIIQVFPKAEEQVATDIFKVSITGGIELSYIISQNCPHIAPPYPEGATIKDVKVQGSTIKAVAYDCANSEGFDAVLTKKSWGDKPENYVKVAKNQDAKTITFTNVKNGRIIWESMRTTGIIMMEKCLGKGLGHGVIQ